MRLEIKNVSKSYVKNIPVLDDINLTLTPGVYGLLGPNGAGKSTLMDIVTDNLKASEGEVLYDGTDIHSMGAQYRTMIGYMPQQQALYENFTGEEFLWYMASLKGIGRTVSRKRIAGLLDMVNLTDERRKKLGSYSGGMKQRILIAQALLNDPQILVLDEPTAGLGPSERIRVRNFLSTISKDKIIMIATHIVSDIESMAKEIVLLKKGKILSSGSPSKLISEISNKVYDVSVGIDEECEFTDARIANIKMDTERKIYKIVCDTPPEGYECARGNAGLSELYLYHFL